MEYLEGSEAVEEGEEQSLAGEEKGRGKTCACGSLPLNLLLQMFPCPFVLHSKIAIPPQKGTDFPR